MKLHKPTCIRCIDDHGFNWNHRDERNWKDEILICLGGGRLNVNEAPPTRCPYILEHLTQPEKL